MTIKKLAAVLGVLALIAVLGVFAAGTVFAQTGTPPAQATPNASGPRLMGRGFGMFGGENWAVFDAEAKALGLTPTELFDQLHSGKTLSEIAQAKGVDLSKVQDAATAARTQGMKDAINQAVQDGKLSKDQGDWLLQGLEKGFLGGAHGFFGFGKGMMRGGMHRGFGGGGKAPAPATPAPGASS